MTDLDLNLLDALDALLSEGSVTGAARKLGLSASAMSRTLTRLRNATGDQLLVRAGRGLVPTPRAIELRDVVHALVRDVRTVLKPSTGEIDMAELDRVFTIDDLVTTNSALFCATGISDSPLVPGVKLMGKKAITHSILMRARSRTVRYIRAVHDLKAKTVHLRSDRSDHAL